MTFVRANRTRIASAQDVIMTSPATARWIVDYFNPVGRCLDPSAGNNAFYDVLPSPKERCEISDGIDFFEWDEPVDWIITNPPYSIFDDFLLHSFELSNHVVFFCPMSKVFKSKRVDDAIRQYGGIKEIVLMGGGTRHGFPFGFPVGCVHYERGYTSSMVSLTRAE